jgi:hypothetical protein
MPLNRSYLIAVLVAATLSTGPVRAEEPLTSAACVQAYEEGQVARKAGRLISARDTLRECARDECPDFIRSDCVAWYGEVQSEVPTVVFAARSQDRDLVDVQVTLDGRQIAARIDGQSLELDPGEYDFAFESPDMQPRTQHSVVVRGERNRLIQVELSPVHASSNEPIAPPATPLARARSRSLLVPGVFAGVGAAGLVGFAVLGASGRASESQLERTCSPNCTDSQISAVRTKYLVADVSLGVGVASLALGAYFLFSQPRAESTARAPAWNVHAGAEGASFIYGGRF